jgi:hypothetical protein
MPCTRRLLQPIKRLHKAAQMMRASKINKTRGLTHINLLLQYTMKKGVLNIKLAKRPPTSNSQSEQQTNSSRLNNRAASILIIKTIPLFESLSNEMRSLLVPLNGAMSMFLYFKNPLGVNDVDT